MSTHTREAGGLSCPTCGAQQELSPVCRRCKCDLQLVVKTIRYGRFLQQQCLRQLGAGAPGRALFWARQRHQLAPDPESRRLLAVACLFLGRYGEAVRLCEGG